MNNDNEIHCYYTIGPGGRFSATCPRYEITMQGFIDLDIAHSVMEFAVRRVGRKGPSSDAVFSHHATGEEP